LEVFFDELGDERAAELTHISADMAGWIARVVAKRAPNAQRCADAFHVVAWAIEALDVERRRAWNQASGRRNPTTSPYRRGKATGTSLQIARARYALWKNPEDLTDNQRAQLDWIAKTDPRLHRAYLLKKDWGLLHGSVTSDLACSRSGPGRMLLCRSHTRRSSATMS